MSRDRPGRDSGGHVSAPGWHPGPPADDSLYVVYSISNNPYQEWQAELLDYSIRKSRQPGTLLRLVSEDHRHPGRTLPLSRAGHTLATPDYSRIEEEVIWPVMNKPGSLACFINSLHPDFKGRNSESVLIFLDPDMIVTRPWNPSPNVAPGRVYGQKWIGYTKHFCEKTSAFADLCPDHDRECVMYPFAITLGDMETLAPEVLRHSTEGYRKCPDWMAGMSAFATAMAHQGLEIAVEDNVGICNNWPNNDDEEAPIVHYCQSIKDHDGSEIWGKFSYEAWSEVPDPSRTTNRVDREVLMYLEEFRENRDSLENSKIN